MRTIEKIKKEYSTSDRKFPLNGEVAKALIKSKGLTYKEAGRPAKISENAVGAWVNNRALAPRNKVLKVFEPMGISDDNLGILVLKHPSEEIRQQMQKRRDQARESYNRTRSNKQDEQSDFDFDEFAEQMINLTQSINQVEQNQKMILEGLKKFDERYTKQQVYSMQELREIKKALHEKNEIIRGFQR